MFARLRRARSVTCVERCVSDGPGTVEFRVDRGVVGGIVASDTTNKPGEGGEVIAMEATTLTALLDEIRAPRHIDYFSLDVEGAEDRVIRGLDFTRYTFDVLTVEEPRAYAHATLMQHGYTPRLRVGGDVFYRRNTDDTLGL